LGCGEFGVVYKGFYKAPNSDPTEARRIIAIKTVKEDMELVHVKSFLAEIKTMAFVGSHENIVEFIGACIERIEMSKWIQILH